MGSEHTITVTYDPATPVDYSGLAILERYKNDEYKCHNVLLKENADIMLKILTDQETAKKAIDYIKSTEKRRKKMENKMNYPVLEIFDIVELRDGRLAVVLLASEEPDEKVLALYSRAYTHVSRIADVNNSYMKCYNNDLTRPNSSDLDIMKVLKYSKIKENCEALENHKFSHGAYMRLVTDIVIRRGSYWDDFKTINVKDRLKPFGWTWEREEVKEVTMDDIENAFGCKIKIVKEEDDGK